MEAKIAKPFRGARPHWVLARQPGQTGVRELGATPWFELRSLAVAGSMERDPAGRSIVHVVVEGCGFLEDGSGARPLRRGDAYMLPAAIDPVTLRCNGNRMLVLEAVAR